jgi:starch phosphorylase
MRTVNAEFNTTRMVEEYTERFYVPCMQNATRLGEENFAKARVLADWRHRMAAAWSGVVITKVDAPPLGAQPMGTMLPVTAHLQLGAVPADEVLVEVYHGLLDAEGQIVDGESATLFPDGENGDGAVVFKGEIPCRRAGQRGYTVRAVPRKDGFPLDRFETGLITWWDGSEAGSPMAPAGTGPRTVHRA